MRPNTIKYVDIQRMSYRHPLYGMIWALNIFFFVKNVIAKLFISGSLVVNSTLRPLVFQQIVKASDMVNGTGRYRKDCKFRLLLDILNILERFQIQCVQ